MTYVGWGMDRGGGIWMIGGLLLLIGLVILVVWAVNKLSARDRPSSRPSSSTPLEILRERFARGEITAEQFEQAKKTLGL